MREISWHGEWTMGCFYATDADVGQAYRDGSMHSELIGPGGCVFRDNDFSLGLFMLMPKMLYRDLDHDTPELYF